MISLVTMATNVDSKFLTIVFLFLSGPDHSVKVSSNSESVRAGALLEFFGGYRELMLSSLRTYLPELCYSGAGWLSSVRTYLPGTVLQWCRLFKQCQNLPAGHCLTVVQTF